MEFFTLYRKPPKCGFRFSLPSLAVQSEKKSCDVNEIMRRFVKTGFIDHVRRDEPLYTDTESIVQKMAEARELVERTDEAFWSLPSAVRDVIGEPSNLPSWLVNNRDEAAKYGFVASEKQEVPPVVQPPVEAAKDVSTSNT